MFCPNCGTEMPEENPKFCLKCGAKLGRDTEPAVEEASTAQTAAPDVSASEEAAIADESPEAAKAPSLMAKLGPNGKLIGIVAAAVVAAVAVTALVVSSCNKPADAPKSDETTQPEPEPEPDSDLTTEEKREFFVGTWVAQGSTDETMTKEWFEAQASQGIYITLILWDDGTGAFRTDTGPVKISWEAESATAATAVIEKVDMPLKLRGKKLTMTNAEGVELYFVPGDEVDMSNAVDLTHQGMGVTVDPNSIEVDEYSKLIGNESVGYMQVPRGWVNRVDDLDPEFVKDANPVYYVDKTTEFLSPSKGHYDFSQMVQMSRHSGSYNDWAQRLVEAYKTDEKYGDCTMTRATVGKRRALVILSSNEEDGINVMSVVIDRDNDEKCTVVLSYNCGSIGDEKPTQWALSFTQTWQVE